ncbi:hypothetical protein [Nocardia yamanashiensis]|uniref:hypothetical protein n=1 Tax=Nocardia yamanashiensis TaxID=209247 RepID=UPI0012FD0F52|nr:hypothetical protein [Nocardia yamanashiensis]
MIEQLSADESSPSSNPPPPMPAWRPELVPLKLASVPLASFITRINERLQMLVDTLGARDFAVPPATDAGPRDAVASSERPGHARGLYRRRILIVSSVAA